MIGKSGLHGWRNAKRLVNATIVVVHEVQRNVAPLPFEFTVIDEKWVIIFFPIKNDPSVLATALVFENGKLANSMCTLFEGLRQNSSQSPVALTERAR